MRSEGRILSALQDTAIQEYLCFVDGHFIGEMHVNVPEHFIAKPIFLEAEETEEDGEEEEPKEPGETRKQSFTKKHLQDLVRRREAGEELTHAERVALRMALRDTQGAEDYFFSKKPSDISKSAYAAWLYAGGTSAPSKMKGALSFALPAGQMVKLKKDLRDPDTGNLIAKAGESVPSCPIGCKLGKKKGSVCNICFGKKGPGGMSDSTQARERRFHATQRPAWAEAVTQLINKVHQGKTGRYFRWHDAGDIYSEAYLKNLMQVWENTPDTKHWVPSRELALLKPHAEEIPSNVTIRISAPNIDQGPLSVPASFNTSTVYSPGALLPGVYSKGKTGWLCPLTKWGAQEKLDKKAAREKDKPKKENSPTTERTFFFHEESGVLFIGEGFDMSLLEGVPGAKLPKPESCGEVPCHHCWSRKTQNVAYAAH